MQPLPVQSRSLVGRRALGAAARPRVAPCKAKAVREETEAHPGVLEGYWLWNGHKVRYQRSGDSGPAVVLVHGFGGNCDHWRKNTPVLGEKYRAYSIDLLGYGYSDKPDPRAAPPNSIYCFENWGRQLVDFMDEVVGSEATVVSNSVGGLAALQAAIYAPTRVNGVQLIDISLRGLHVKRQNPLARPFVAAFQRLLKETDVGKAFFANVARPETVKSVLQQCYARKEAVTDELVNYILKPGLQPGAVDVFLDFISYSGGPLPEELIEQVTVPVSLLWGTDDPWESCTEGRKLFGGLPPVTEFIEMQGLGHCPQDEAPEVVNPLIDAFVASCQQRKGATVAAVGSQVQGQAAA